MNIESTSTAATQLIDKPDRYVFEGHWLNKEAVNEKSELLALNLDGWFTYGQLILALKNGGWDIASADNKHYNRPGGGRYIFSKNDWTCSVIIGAPCADFYPPADKSAGNGLVKLWKKFKSFA